jgi:hypothetical protein
MRVEQPRGDHSKELSLSLDFIEPNVLQSTHLIHHRISYEDGNVQFLYFEIDPKLIKLVGRQPLKVLKKAVLEGLVIRADGLREQLDEPISEPPGKTPEQAEEWVFSPPEDAEFNTDDIIEVGTIRFKRNNY